MYARIFDLLHTDGLIVEHAMVIWAKHAAWVMDTVLLLLMIIERYYAIKNNETYDESSSELPARIISIVFVIFVIIGSLTAGMSIGMYPRKYYIAGMLILALFVLFSYVISLPIISAQAKRVERRRFELNQSNYIN
ncbi:hypothetical protein PFISCL1PPCAC_13552, partial [Pristionchus fissidentatus]